MNPTIPFTSTIRGRGRIALTARNARPADKAVGAPWIGSLLRRPELLVFAVLLAIFNVPMLVGSFPYSMIFQPAAAWNGAWWRWFTHPFVHVTWYHLLLDGSSFFMLYHSLAEVSLARRLTYVLASGAGSALVACATAPSVLTGGLCGLSGIAHGLMAVSALEMMCGPRRDPAEFRLGLISLVLVVGKAALEAVSGRMFFTFLHFGLMGNPVAVSHAGGIIGSLLAAALLMKRSPEAMPKRG